MPINLDKCSYNNIIDARKRRQEIGYIAELKFSTSYLDVPIINVQSESDDWFRYKLAISEVDKQLNIREKAFAILVAILNKESLREVVVSRFNRIKSGHPECEIVPLVILAFEILSRAEEYVDLIKKYKYSSVKKFITDIRLKLSFVITQVNNANSYSFGSDEFQSLINQWIEEDKFPSNQLSKHIVPFSADVINRVPTDVSNDSEFEEAIIEYEPQHLKDRWNSIAFDKEVEDSCSDIAMVYASQVVESFEFPSIGVTEDDIYSLGEMFIKNSKSYRDKYTGLCLKFFSPAIQKEILLSEYNKLKRRGNNEKLVTVTPFAFLELTMNKFVGFESQLLDCGLTRLEMSEIRTLIMSFFEKYYYLKACVDFDVTPDFNLLDNKIDDREHYEYEPGLKYFSLSHCFSINDEKIINSNYIDNSALSSYIFYSHIKGDYIDIPERLRGSKNEVICVKFSKPILGILNIY